MICEGMLDDHRVIALLEDHLAGMHANSPPESVHALDLSGLKVPGVSFWTLWKGEDLLGCGAMKEIAPDHGEIKSMRTAGTHLRKGAGARLLEHIIETARTRGYIRLSLETGSGEAFDPAHRLYERYGFIPTSPFGSYTNDPFSRFFTLELARADA